MEQKLGAFQASQEGFTIAGFIWLRCLKKPEENGTKTSLASQHVETNTRFVLKRAHHTFLVFLWIFDPCSVKAILKIHPPLKNKIKSRTSTNISC